MTRHVEALETGVNRILGRPLSTPERATFLKYLLLLVKWGKAHRMIGSGDPEWIVIHIFLDSLLFLRVLPVAAARILDLGAGAGVPGIPIRIVNRDLSVTMIEGRQRRASFLAESVRELRLLNCQVVADRAESAVDALGGQFDAVVMRCAGAPERTVPLAQRFIAPGGMVILSGPPKARASEHGRWVEVEGVEPGTTRRFLVAGPGAGRDST